MTDHYTHIRAAFHEVSLSLMSWTPCPLVTPHEYRRLEQVRQTWTPIDKQANVEPFDIDADWKELA